jgi:septum site-determining protein MinC
MANQRITIKGTSNGLIVKIGAGVWQGLLEELDTTLADKASFFKGGRVALQVGPRQLTRPQLESVGHILKRHGVTLWAVEGDAPGTQDAAAQLNLETRIAPARIRVAASNPAKPDGNSIVIRRTLRSGQVIHHPGDIVIIGDVNPGAEIKAGGSVIVWGRLRGSVFAGAANGRSSDAVVCALRLSPMQLRIGDHITRAPADDDSAEIVPEMASIQDGQIVAEPWHG